MAKTREYLTCLLLRTACKCMGTAFDQLQSAVFKTPWPDRRIPEASLGSPNWLEVVQGFRSSGSSRLVEHATSCLAW